MELDSDRESAPANLVLGQPDFTSNTANNGGLSASGISQPTDVQTDGTESTFRKKRITAF